MGVFCSRDLPHVDVDGGRAFLPFGFLFFLRVLHANSVGFLWAHLGLTSPADLSRSKKKRFFVEGRHASRSCSG